MGIINKVSRFVGPAVLPKISYQKKIIDTYTHFYLSEKVSQNTILYESRDGKSLTDSPFAIFEYLLETDTERVYTHIWVVTKNEELEHMQKKYLESNIQFVIRNSDEYLKWLTKAQYLINNSTFQPFVTIKKEQTYINTWHGTPLKTMGFDIPGNPANAKNVVRNFFMADYLISPNPHTTRMFRDSYRLKDNYAGVIIEDGYPRIDQSLNNSKEDLIELLKEFNVEIDLSKKILLYTPTCKEASLAVSTDQVTQIHTEMSVVREKFGEEYNVLIKVHPFLYAEAKKYPALKPYLIPDVIDTNKLLAVTDCLITDYSSIFFDFLVTDKPILFYCWDDDLYGNERGKYIEYDELPGPVSFNLEELIQSIERLAEEQPIYQEKYQLFKETYTPYDDGHVTKRMVDIVFHQKHVPNVKLIQPNQTKQHLLIYPGGMRSNGITSSFLNLLNSIDFETYSVTCFLDEIQTPDQITNVSQIPENVSLLFRFNAPNYTAKEHYQDLIIHLNGVKKGKEDKYPANIYKREIARLLGKRTFDVAIDFSGYSLHWSKMILGATANKYICYLHSDMKLDQQRVVDGKKPHEINLKGIFSVYDKYDKLVSVSEVINQVNQEKLADYADKEKFVYATNTINPDKILGKITKKEKTKTIETKRMYRNGQINDLSKAYKVLSSRPDTLFGGTQNKTFTKKEVLVLGQFIYEEVTYYKIMQDNVYLGWLNADDLEVEPVKIVTENQVSYFAKVDTRKEDFIYSGPIGLETSVPLVSAEYLRNLYVEITHEVVTQEKTSLEINISGEKIGYLDKDKLAFSRRLNWTKNNQPPLKQKVMRTFVSASSHLSLKKIVKQSENQPIEKIGINSYYENKSSEGLIGFDLPDTSQIAKQISNEPFIYVVSEIKTPKNSFYEVLTETEQTYWLEKAAADITPITQTVVVSTKEINETISFKGNEITVYATPEDCIKHKGTVVRRLDQSVATKEIQLSTKETFLLVKWENKSLWVAVTDIEKQESKGIYNAEGEFFPFPSKDQISIVTTGRLSQEKNQITLIKGFTEFNKKHPNSVLYIIGSGPEEKFLKNEIKDSKLENRVIMLGQVYHPFAFMKKCQIFALTSLYEGQSIVLLEALTLGMKCLSTDIPACRSVLGDGDYGLLTKTNDSNGVCSGLEELLEGTKNFKTFDAYKYNEEALHLFYKTLS